MGRNAGSRLPNKAEVFGGLPLDSETGIAVAARIPELIEKDNKCP
jgi:hypothetical protein